jgi:hemoglobin
MTTSSRSTLLALLVFAVPPAPAADPPSRFELDARVVKSLAGVIDVGAPLFNGGDPEGCFRLYQGSLMAVTPLLDHQPELQQRVQQQLNRVRSLRSAPDRAFALRAALDDVRATLSKTTVQKSLWDRLGGEPAVKAVVHDFVLAAAPDPKVNFTRDGKFPVDDAGVAKLERLLVELISAVTGGPLKYTGRDMATTHAGMKITDAEFDALAGHLIATLKKYNVPQKEVDKLVGIVASTRKDIVGK